MKQVTRSKTALLSLIAATSLSMPAYLQAAWSDYIPFKWFVKNKTTATQQLLVAIASNARPVEILSILKRGADVNYQDSNGFAQALFLAIAANNKEVVKLLLDHGANLNLKDNKFGITPIFICLQFPEILELLLEYGANPNVQLITGQTPLIIAVAENDITSVKLLLQYGAEKDIKDLEEKTALDYAQEFNFSEIIALLEDL